MFAPLNDYTATVIGMVRDDVPFNTLLSADLVYVGKRASPACRPTPRPTTITTRPGDHAASDLKSGPDHRRRSQPSPACRLRPPPASSPRGPPPQAFFIAGTNRAMFRFTMLNHLCRDMEQVKDTTRPPDRIRQDVSAQPGRRQPDLPEQLHRLPQRHGPDGAGLRLLQLRCRPPGSSCTRRAQCSRST